MPSSDMIVLGKRAAQNDKNHLVKPSRTVASSYRQLLPIVLCLITFATVLSILIIYMDTTGNNNISKKPFSFEF